MRKQEARTYQLVQHARERAEEMGVSETQIYETLLHPETDYPSHPKYNGPGEARRVATRNSLAVVYETTKKQVITVLWNRNEGRDDDGQPIKA